jgi:class 3 adenylate cyclase
MVSESFGVAGTGSAAPPRSTLLTFLIADFRGYTRFTVEHGDEAAARLAGIFARIAKDVARAHGGEVIELRGDEALAVFDSARNALRTAVALQERFARQMALDPAVPLTVGMGLDAGEAVPVAGGYRGGALNRAARLCSLAGPGEVLCSQEVSHLAGRTVGITVRGCQFTAGSGFSRAFDTAGEFQ